MHRLSLLFKRPTASYLHALWQFMQAVARSPVNMIDPRAASQHVLGVFSQKWLGDLELEGDRDGFLGHDTFLGTLSGGEA